MDTFFSQCIQVNRRRSHQSFTFTRLHFTNITFVKHHATNKLDNKMQHSKYPTRGFSYHTKSTRTESRRVGKEVLISDWSSDLCSSDLLKSYKPEPSSQHHAVPNSRSLSPHGHLFQSVHSGKPAP